MLLKVVFPDTLKIDINVTVTQKEDDRVAKLEKQQNDWLKTLAASVKKVEEISKQVDSNDSPVF